MKAIKTFELNGNVCEVIRTTPKRRQFESWLFIESGYQSKTGHPLDTVVRRTNYEYIDPVVEFAYQAFIQGTSCQPKKKRLLS